MRERERGRTCGYTALHILDECDRGFSSGNDCKSTSQHLSQIDWIGLACLLFKRRVFLHFTMKCRSSRGSSRRLADIQTYLYSLHISH